ncbi:MAG: DNA-processing protein DprA [Candidatus Sericytochromatia bacterium]
MKQDYPYCVAFNKIQGLGPIKIYAIFQYFSSFENAWKANINDFRDIKNISENNLKDILKAKKEIDPDKEYTLIEKNNVKIVTLHDEEYPSLLKKIHDPPFIIFYKGIWDKNIFDKCVGVVGTRTPSFYGKKTALKLGYELSMYNVTVVSGMALGIDTEVHKGALQCNKGKTIAVLGCSPDLIYPYSNKKLYEEICEKGLVISEYPPETQPDIWRFPARNRIISGLSKGVLLIEAGNKSGALITTDFALEQGREVMAIPGDIFNKMSIGANNLIKQGAEIITSVDDIINHLGWNIEYIEKKSEPLKTATKPKNKKEEYNKGIEINNLDLNNYEKELYLILEDTQPIHLDDIVKKTELNLADISSNLIMLELKGLIKQMSGKLFVRT